jgi:ribosome-associated toxin RatA of RatAB toxin-antitoxin module
MKSVHVTRTIPGPPEPIFDLLADHANYDRFRAINASELLREGDPPPNGVGALRSVKVRPLSFEEEITAY